MYNSFMIFKTLRQLFKFKKIKTVEVARLSGYSRQTIHANLDEIPDHVRVRVLREMAAAGGARVVITFELEADNESRTNELCRTDSGQA